MLGFCTGHHVLETYHFSFTQVDLKLHKVLVKPFKFFRGGSKVASPMLIILCNFVKRFYPTVFQHCQPAKMFFDDPVSFESTFNAYIKHSMDVAGITSDGFHEDWSTRLIRRTTASVQNFLGSPVDAICYFLNDKSRSVAKNYVAKLSPNDQAYIQQYVKFFTLFQLKPELCPDHQTVKPLYDIVSPEPIHFSFHGTEDVPSNTSVMYAPAPKRRVKTSGSNLPDNQPVITQWMKQ
jgi:hypothetical protein